MVDDNHVRSSQEDELYRLLQNRGQQILLYGQGGTGKTFMARKLFYRLKKDYDRLAWVEYGTDMKTSLLAAFCKTEEIVEDSVRFSKIIEQLAEKPQKTILFIDDAKENAAYDDVLARITGLGITIFVTSRCREIKPYKSYEISPLSDDDCVRLFYSYYRYDRHQKHSLIVKDLSVLLNHNVMSIIMLARVIGKPNKLNSYYEQLKTKYLSDSKSSLNLLKEHIGNLLKLSNLSKEENQVLQCFALMPSGETPSEIIRYFNLESKNIYALVEKGWLSENKQGCTFVLHDLVREYLQERGLHEKVFIQFFKYVIQDKYFLKKDTSEDIQNKIECVEYALSLANSECLLFVKICCWLGEIYSEKGVNDKSLFYYQKALNIEKNKVNTDSDILFDIYWGLAIVLEEKGMYQDALLNYQNAELYINKSSDSYEHYTMTIQNNIGNIYLDMGNYTQALKTYQKTLSLNREMYGETNRYTAGSYNNIGNVYNYMADYNQALETHLKALEIRDQLSENVDMDLVSSYGNLGTTYYNLGEYKRALEFLEKSVALSKKVFGENHQHTLFGYCSLGVTYLALDEYEKAFENLHKAIEISERVLGLSHPYTASYYSCMGELLYKMKKYEDAMNFQQKALDIRAKVLTSDHIDLAESYNGIGRILNVIGKTNEALEHHKIALEIQEKNLPMDHPDIADTFCYISDVYVELKKQELALQYVLKGYISCLKKLGDSHPETKEKFETLQTRFKQLHPNGDFESWYSKELTRTE